MKIRIEYRSRYSYSEKAGFSPHWVRIFPRADLYARVAGADFRTHESASALYRRDLFDNVVACCFFPGELDTLEFDLDLDVEIAERNPFAFLLEARALEVPLQYDLSEAEVLAPFLKRGDSFDLPAGLRPGAARPTVEMLTGLNSWIFENIAYERREEGAAMAPGETLAGGRGSCRDFAVLFAEVLKIHGIASRLASGFLWEPDTPESERKAESAMHAWVEAYLPGPGWIGLDPTNGVLCDHYFLTTAVGLQVSDITPVSGFYYGNRKIESRMESELLIKEVP